MEPEQTRAITRRIVTRSVSIALVAATAFGAGLLMGNTGSTASAISRLPLLGDGLDATPNESVELTSFWKAWNALQRNYVITHSSSTLPTNKEMLYGAIQGLASSYGDPYTVFLPPKESQAFAENIAGSFGGVGMELGIKDNVLTVIAPVKGSPSEAAGIKAGDKIVGINDKPTDGITIEQAISKIRGPVDTTVEISILRDGKLQEITLTRAVIQIPQTDDGLDPKSGVYHIALFEFTSNSAQLFNQAFTRFKASNSRKLVIDLRGNPGGYLDSAVRIASHFLPKGAPIVTEDFGEKQKSTVHTSLGFADLPPGTKVVVLIDSGSASASEIFAAALQDTRVATLIGTKTFGKGSVQQLIPLDGGSLKITVARWVTPAGHWIMGNGVTPDITVPYTKKDAEAKTDPQMARAIEFLTTGK